MSELTERLNYFTGFFTTARDWTEGQNYHIEKRRLHNRGLHTSGIIPGEGEDFFVEATGGMTVSVLPGAAIDGAGNDICIEETRVVTIDISGYALPETVYIGVRYNETPTHYVQNMENPEYSGHTRVSETPSIIVGSERPDNNIWVEIARIHVQAGATEILNPTDPYNPGGNEIDRRYIKWAGNSGITSSGLPGDLQERLIQLMIRNRKDFAALDMRFPVPSSGDARNAALTLEMLTRSLSVTAETLPGLIATLASIEQDVSQELGGAVYRASSGGRIRNLSGNGSSPDSGIARGTAV